MGGAQQVKPILVVSHERSGTHFLINTIASNFACESPLVNVPQYGLASSFFHNYYNREESCILKSHHQFFVYMPFFYEEALSEKFHIFYVVRDGRDVLTSCWNYFNQSPDTAFPHTKHVGDLLRTDVSEFPYSKGYTQAATANTVTRWITHIDSWKDVEGVHMVKYEDLLSDFTSVVTRLASILGQSLPSEVYKPTLSDMCVSPWRGKISTWREFFTSEDILFFHKHAGDTLIELGYSL